MPGKLGANANRSQLFFSLVLLSLALGGFLAPVGQSGQLPIGQIQGRDGESPFLDRQVGFQGIVTGIREDQNVAGIRYYTFFVQSGEWASDGDPLTSDGLAVFTGRTRPRTKIGDLVEVWGVVTEFYGLTEIDDKGLYYQVISSDNSLPVPVELIPPTELAESAGYYEALEGMLVKSSFAVTVGPTHSGCGFSVKRDDFGSPRLLKHSRADSRGDVIKVLYYSDVDCEALPALATGDRIEGIVGPLTYHFDQYKVVLQESIDLRITKFEQPQAPQPAELRSGQFTVASFNLENYFDAIDDTGQGVEPVPSLLEINIKQIKLAYTIANSLACPTIIGIQEVEKFDLLSELSQRLTNTCGFAYEVSHLDTADARGIDLALLSNPGRAAIIGFSQYQTCSQTVTEISDPAISCSEGEEPLFARQPFIVNLEIDGMPLTVIVNHFKSKREGEHETEPWRIAQAQALNILIRQMSGDQEQLALVVLGDFNDYDQAPVRKTLTESGILVDALSSIPEQERYSYIFDGESQLTDWILVSPILGDKVIEARIAHVNADYPHQLKTATVPELIAHRSSDHDIPIVTFDNAPPNEPQASPTSLAMATASEAVAGSLPASPQPTLPETNSGSKDKELLHSSDDKQIGEIDETIKTETGAAEIGNQVTNPAADPMRLPESELIILAIALLCVLAILVIAVLRRLEKRQR